VSGARAVWDPGWYDGDQSIAIRLTDEFFFWEAVPTVADDPGELRFYSDLGRGQVIAGRGTIARIWHPELGEIREIDTGADNYRVYLANGTVFDVDQEQNPGSVGDAWAFDVDGKAQPRRAPGVQRWRIDVEFEHLSDLRPVEPQAWQTRRRRRERRMTLDELSQRHGVALAKLVEAADSLGLSVATAEPLAADEVYVVEAQLGLDRR